MVKHFPFYLRMRVICHRCYLLIYSVLYCTVLYCTVLYCTLMYCTVLYCTFSFFSFNLGRRKRSILYEAYNISIAEFAEFSDYHSDYGRREERSSRERRESNQAEVYLNQKKIRCVCLSDFFIIITFAGH